jgi:hypothetical protein
MPPPRHEFGLATATPPAQQSPTAMPSAGPPVQFQQETAFDSPAVVGFATPAHNVLFPRPRIYSILILLKGEEVGRRDFNIAHQPRPNQ